MSLPDEFKDAFERATWSAGQQFLSVIVVAAAMIKVVTGLPWSIALWTALGAAVASLLLSVVQFSLGARTLPLWVNIGVRVVKTFAASLLAELGASAINVLTFHWTVALDTAAIATILALGKGALSMHNPIPAATRRPGAHA